MNTTVLDVMDLSTALRCALRTLVLALISAALLWLGLQQGMSDAEVATFLATMLVVNATCWMVLDDLPRL